MLGNYEKRHFAGVEKIWIGRYQSLSNILHWHSECELIQIVSGEAEIKIGNTVFEGVAGDTFFCPSEELHYIISKNNSLIDIIFFHNSLLQKITQKYKILTPLLTNPEKITTSINNIRQILSQKPPFYSEIIQNYAENLLLKIFSENEICMAEDKKQTDKKIIDKIDSDFATITFKEITSFSGYSPSHFSKFFKSLTGMTFSDYLNYIKIEHAISLIQSKEDLTVTQISLKCGFGTIRNFNRVFKKITGYSPAALPKDFATNINIQSYNIKTFNPTLQNSILL